MLLMSVGVDCQCGYQLRRLRGTPHAFFWDWLVSPDPETAVFRVIEDRGARLLEPSNVRVSANGTRVVDDYYGLEFQHDFPSDAAGLVLREQVPFAVHDVRSKYRFLLGRMLQAMRDRAVLFVRHVRNPEALTTSIWRSRLQVLLPSTRVFVALASEEYATSSEVDRDFRLALRPPPDGRWQGDDSAWSQAITFCLARIARSTPGRDTGPAS